MSTLEFILRQFQEQNGWSWLVLAVVLLIGEVVAPGIFLIWFGFAAAIVGTIILMAPDMSVPWQLALFSVTSIVCVVAGRQFWGSYRNPSSDKPNLNERGRQHVGEIFELVEPIRGGRGRVVVGDSTWLVKGPEMPAGTRVRVTGTDGTMLVVEQA